MKFLRIPSPNISQKLGSCFADALKPAIHNALGSLIFRYRYIESYLTWRVYMDSLGNCIKKYSVFQIKIS